MSKVNLGFTPECWGDYLYWQRTDKKIVQKINRLLEEVLRTPFSGTGKPEPLRGNYSGYWSRRITDEHRLVYSVSDDELRIVSSRHHY